MIALLLVLALLGAWELFVELDGTDPLLLPAPSAIAEALWEDRSLLWDDFKVTGLEMVGGLGIALALSLGLAATLHFSPLLRRALLPLFIGSQAVPVAVLSPVLVAWWGFGAAPKLAIIALVCFFPMVVPTIDGLQRTDDELRRMMRTFGASRWRTFRLVEAPAALPGLLTGARLSVAVAGIAAYLAEGSGAEDGLGHLIDQAIYSLDTARAWAGVVILSAFAIALFGLLALAERHLLPWSRADAQGSRT